MGHSKVPEKKFQVKRKQKKNYFTVSRAKSKESFSSVLNKREKKEEEEEVLRYVTLVNQISYSDRERSFGRESEREKKRKK